MHSDQPDLGTIEEACAILGGKRRPLARSSYYRGVRSLRYPAPVKVSPNISRVDLNKVRDVARRIVHGEPEVG
jgi:hypothetical protein